MDDFLIYNANIYTMEDSDELYSAMAIQNGKFVKLWKIDPEEPKELAKRVQNAQQATVLPGFTDAHAHFIETAIFLAMGKPISEMISSRLLP